MDQQNTLAATWSQVTSLLEHGFSIIPVKDTGINAKRPYATWKKYQNEIILPSDLWTEMADKFNTTAIAVICGKISGNLEIIDIDVKWKQGIDALIFGDIKILYPQLWEKLRIHRSPSGGYHIPYRIIEEPPGRNKHLAKRILQEEEKKRWLDQHPDKDKAPKFVCFVETRGEGGYALMPPSLGYSVFKAQPIPHLTLAERNALISICSQRNEIITLEQPPNPSKRRDDNYYDENPFDHFNKSEAGENLLIELGWKKHRNETNEFAWFSKPSSQSGERHATWIKKRRAFWFWTTHAEVDSEKTFTPAAVLTQYKFNGDYKQSYKHLVERGFGRIKTKIEDKLVRSGSQAPNLSPSAQEASQRLQEARSSLHPYGIFWEFTPEGDKALINREALYKAAEALGFRSWKGEVYRLCNGFLLNSNEREFQDQMKAYIQEPDPIALDTIINTYEHFLQVAGKFTLTRLPLLDESKLLKDTHNTCYKFYSDCWIQITANQVLKYSYSELGDRIILPNKSLNRPFVMNRGGLYLDFLDKAVEFEKMENYVLKIIGYLAHEYKHETTAYIPVFTEQCPDPKMGGGSGKNLFSNLFKLITTVTNKPGEQVKYDEKFFQSWNGQKILVVSDAPKDFKFLFLKDITSNSAILKKLFKDEAEVDVDELPKIIVNTNYSYEIHDGGLKRRIIPLEFTDFFTVNGGVKKHYNGKFFPDDWTEEDWAGFDWAMITGIQEWMRSALTLDSTQLTFGGWKKQFEQTYGAYTAEFIYENFETWQAIGFVSNLQFKQQMDEHFTDRGVNKIYWPSGIKVNKALEDYAHRMNYVINTQSTSRDNTGAVVKGRRFDKQEENFF